MLTVTVASPAQGPGAPLGASAGPKDTGVFSQTQGCFFLHPDPPKPRRTQPACMSCSCVRFRGEVYWGEGCMVASPLGGSVVSPVMWGVGLDCPGGPSSSNSLLFQTALAGSVLEIPLLWTRPGDGEAANRRCPFRRRGSDGGAAGLLSQSYCFTPCRPAGRACGPAGGSGCAPGFGLRPGGAPVVSWPPKDGSRPCLQLLVTYGPGPEFLGGTQSP